MKKDHQRKLTLWSCIKKRRCIRGTARDRTHSDGGSPRRRMMPQRPVPDERCAVYASTRPVANKCMCTSTSISRSTFACVVTRVPATIQSTTIKGVELVPHKASIKTKIATRSSYATLGGRRHQPLGSLFPHWTMKASRRWHLDGLPTYPSRRPVKKRLIKPVHTSRVYVSETHPELERLEAESRWHEREAEKYREGARRWRRD